MTFYRRKYSPDAPFSPDKYRKCTCPDCGAVVYWYDLQYWDVIWISRYAVRHVPHICGSFDCSDAVRSQ